MNGAIDDFLYDELREGWDFWGRFGCLALGIWGYAWLMGFVGVP